MNENISTKNWLLGEKQRQANRTGDHEGFAPEIRQIEDKIKNLERQVVDARNIVRQWREDASKLVSQMARNQCDGFI